MKNWLEIILSGGLQGHLKDNEPAMRLYNLVKSGSFYSLKDEDLLNRMISGASKKITVSKEEDIDKRSIKDLRFLSLLVKNVKKYPLGKNGEAFGVYFSEDSIPQNTILLGSNGVGKTSLYAALEFLGLGKMNTAEIRGYKRKIYQQADVTGNVEDSQKSFLTHLGTELSDVSITVPTRSEVLKWNGTDNFPEILPLVPEAFYCSDFDIRKLESSDNYTEFLITQLGLSECFKALNLIYSTGYEIYQKYTQFSSITTNYKRTAEETLKKGTLALRLGIIYNKDLLPVIYLKLPLLELFSSRSSSILKNIQYILENELRYLRKYPFFTKELRELYIKALDDIKQLTEAAKNKLQEPFDNIYRGLEDFSRFRLLLFQERDRAYGEYNKKFGDESNIHDFIDNSLEEYVKLKYRTEEEKKYSKYITDPEEREIYTQQIFALIEHLENSIQSLLKEWLDKVSVIVSEVLEDYFTYDNDKLVINTSFNSYINSDVKSGKTIPNLGLLKDREGNGLNIRDFLRVNINISSKQHNLLTCKPSSKPPRAYLNTFKYKLFGVALKFALFIVAKDIYSINYPFIIDDVFNASDFESRINLKDFIEELVENHNKLLGDTANPLQLIFFTQDDLIAQQVEKGVRLGSEFLYKNNIRFARIFDYYEILDDQSKISEDNGQKFLSLEDSIYGHL